jgi:hypothetical protein
VSRKFRKRYSFLQQTAAVVSHIRVRTLTEDIDDLFNDACVDESGEIDRGVSKQVGNGGDGIDEYVVIFYEEPFEYIDDDGFDF